MNNIEVNDENDLLGEYPDDDYQDDEEEELVDSDGEPLPTPEQVRDIINAIPSYKFEEKGKLDNSDNKQEAKGGSVAANDSHTER